MVWIHNSNLQGLVAHAFTPSIRKAGAGGILWIQGRSSLHKQVPVQPGVHSESLSQKQTNKRLQILKLGFLMVSARAENAGIIFLKRKISWLHYLFIEITK